MSVSLRRYHQSPKAQSSFMLSTRFSSSKQKPSMLNLTQSIQKNPQIDMHLPSLSRSSMRKSFSIFQSDRNTKFKLTTLEDKLQQIKSHLHQLRQQTKQSLQFTSLLKQTYVNKQLAGITKDLKANVSAFQNFVRATKHQHQTRSNQLRNDCDQLWESNQTIKEMVFQLRMKVDSLDQNMGYQNN